MVLDEVDSDYDFTKQVDTPVHELLAQSRGTPIQRDIL